MKVMYETNVQLMVLFGLKNQDCAVPKQAVIPIPALPIPRALQAFLHIVDPAWDLM